MHRHPLDYQDINWNSRSMLFTSLHVGNIFLHCIIFIALHKLPHFFHWHSTVVVPMRVHMLQQKYHTLYTHIVFFIFQFVLNFYAYFYYVGATIILLRNINPKKILCNHTRLIVRDLQRHVICTEIISNEYSGQYVISRFSITNQHCQVPAPSKACVLSYNYQSTGIIKVCWYLPSKTCFQSWPVVCGSPRIKSFASLEDYSSTGMLTQNVVYCEVLK